MAYRLLFPLAALYALVIVPVWIELGVLRPIGIVTTWHGHEMLFGFALAVIAGFLSTRPLRGAAWVLAGSWFAGRIAAATGSGIMAVIAGIAFPLAVLIISAPPLLASAKRKENRVLPVILVTLVCTDAAWWAGKTWFSQQVQSCALLAAIDLIALLLLLIGGRALRAAVGGHLERQGVARQDYAQRRYEIPLATLAGGAALADALALESIAAALCIGAALITLVRVMPWQLQRTVSHPQLWALALGYLWLVPGLMLKGIAQIVDNIPVGGMLHGIGIGALGTLTLVMMARTATLRAHKPITEFGDIGVAAILVSAAALFRLTAPLIPGIQCWFLWLAAVAWSSAFLILLARFWRTAMLARSGQQSK
jgi:uncharacterized protein involved in response to NO